MIKAISVIPNKDFSITVNLEDGRTIRMDMSFIFKKNGPVVDPLKNEEGFKKYLFGVELLHGVRVMI